MLREISTHFVKEDEDYDMDKADDGEDDEDDEDDEDGDEDEDDGDFVNQDDGNGAGVYSCFFWN